MVSIAASTSYERLPVVVERLDASDRGTVLGESEDLVVALVERVVEPTKRDHVASLRAAKDAIKPLGQTMGTFLRCMERCLRFNAGADLGALTATGSSYAKAKAQCQTTCSSPGAHMCSGEELTRSAAINGPITTAGWYSTGAAGTSGATTNYECGGPSNAAWTNPAATVSGSVWSAVSAPAFITCNASFPVLCCE